MIIVYIIKVIVNMQFLLCLETFEILGFEFEHNQMSMNKKEIQLKHTYVIVVIFGVKNGYQMLDQHFEPIYGELESLLEWAQLGFELGFHDHA